MNSGMPQRFFLDAYTGLVYIPNRLSPEVLQELPKGSYTTSDKFTFRYYVK